MTNELFKVTGPKAVNALILKDPVYGSLIDRIRALEKRLDKLEKRYEENLFRRFLKQAQAFFNR